MDHSNSIETKDYRYILPDERIAKYPLDKRNQSKLLCYSAGSINHHTFDDLPNLLEDSNWLVFNSTRVIQARMEFRKPTGASIEIFCLEPLDPLDYEQSFHSLRGCSWKCLVGNAKKWKEGEVFLTSMLKGQFVTVSARIMDKLHDSYTIEFSWDNNEFSFGQIIENAGNTPIPPYLDREAEVLDKERYQTIYGIHPGSVAAPTAGLHFTEDVIKRLDKKGLRSGELILHVGAGTFVPVKESNARHHLMHAEQVEVSLSFIEEWKSRAENVISVGTTSTRSLESLYWLGVRLYKGESVDPDNIRLLQWQNEVLAQDIPIGESIGAIHDYCLKLKLEQIRFSTQLMITPGYDFKAIRGLITNFHMPGSTLLLLIAALIGKDWKKVYDEALQNNYRFLSYGDSSLLLP